MERLCLVVIFALCSVFRFAIHSLRQRKARKSHRHHVQQAIDTARTNTTQSSIPVVAAQSGLRRPGCRRNAKFAQSVSCLQGLRRMWIALD
jgi:hypothetical protein